MLGSGGAPTVVNVWATWCPPCREELPYLADLHARFSAEGLRVAAVSVDSPSDTSKVTALLDSLAPGLVAYIAPRHELMSLLGLRGLPATFLVDGTGSIRLARIGMIRRGDAAVESLLEELVN